MLFEYLVEITIILYALTFVRNFRFMHSLENYILSPKSKYEPGNTNVNVAHV